MGAHESPGGEPQTSTCTFTGLPVLSHPDWTNVPFGTGFRATIQVVGQRILFVQAAGFLSQKACRDLFDFFNQKIETTLTAPGQLTVVHDLYEFRGLSRRARLAYFSQLRAQRFAHLIFFGLSGLRYLTFKLGVLVHRFQVPHSVTATNAEALALAMSSPIEPHIETPSQRLRVLPPLAEVERGGQICPVTGLRVTSRPEWTDIPLGQGYSATFKFVGDRILLSSASGWQNATKEAVRRHFEWRQRVLAAMLPQDAGYIELRDYAGKTRSPSREVRVEFIKKQQEDWPRMLGFVAFNTSMAISLIVNVAKRIHRPPFPVAVAPNYETAMKTAIRILGAPGNPHREERNEATHPGDTEVQGYVDELVRYIGSINWEQEGSELSEHVPASHPFRAVFDGIALIKGELEDLIQAQQRATQTLVQSEEKYRTIIESIEEGYFELDTAGRFTFWNRAFCRSMGYSSKELAKIDYRDLLDRDQARRAFRVFCAVRRGQQTKELGGWDVIRKDGSTAFIEASMTLRRDASGTPIGMRGIARDLSERRQAEEERGRLEERLQHAQRMEAIGTLAGGVAHDLNNILSGIVSYPDLLLMDVSPESPLRGPLLTIKQSGEKAATIVRDLLSLARRGVATTEVASLNDVVREYLGSPEFCALQQHHPQVEVSMDLDDELLNLRCSQVHLSKTLMNLVSNAAEAMPDGGRIQIGTRNRYMDSPVAGYEEVEEGDYVALSVTDGGVGISPENLKRVFEPFYTKKVMGRSGTGLGMAVVWATVKDHKGYIDVESTEGEGTRFSLYFPATRIPTCSADTATSLERYRGNGESILVVDDVAEQRTIASGTLEKLGYMVTTVGSGEEAVELFAGGARVDLVVLDMIMSTGMDGLETYREILKLQPGQKALITSGFSESQRVRTAQRLGVGAYVRKPYLIERFGMAVKKELERAGTGKE